MSFNDKIKTAKLPHIRVPLCLNSDLVFAYGQAVAALSNARKAAEKAGDQRLAGGNIKTAEVLEAEAALEEIEPQMLEASMYFEVTALPFETYNELLLSYPPREGNAGDERAGYNTLAFYIEAAERTALYVEEGAEPEKLSAIQWAELRASLPDGEWDSLIEAVEVVNRRKQGQNVDLFSNASKAMRASDAMSESPTPSE